MYKIVKDLKLHCLNYFWKSHSSVLNFSPQNAENRILGYWNFKIFWSGTHPNPPPPPLPKKKGTNGPLLILSRLLYSNRLATSILIESPADFLPSSVWSLFRAADRYMETQIKCLPCSWQRVKNALCEGACIGEKIRKCTIPKWSLKSECR